MQPDATENTPPSSDGGLIGDAQRQYEMLNNLTHNQNGELDDSARKLPEPIGPYRPIRVLGRGGMGIVYLAEQTQPIRRKVALKLIKVGMDTEQVVKRFEAERQALAMMNHVNVARVLDAGATEVGRPYFVMEYVPGIPITEYCDKHRLSTEERVRLLVDVCHAVQHAHQKGIIHRDIKPSNVLVTVLDEKAVPKVIDFGVAKATQQPLTPQTLFTEMGQLIGTPGYMSPEQAEMSALDIDTRTDIYSLGVLLYELLVGARPFDDQFLRQAGFAEIQRIIREVDPPKPSTKLSDIGPSSTDIAQRRRTEPKTLVRQLRGDLDWIAMKAIEKDRTRRYSTASELAEEITRFLNNEPITARPPSSVYLLKKLLRRHRGPARAVLGIAIALSAGVTVSTMLYINAQRERERANAEAQKSRLVASFFGGMLSSEDLVTAHGLEVTVRQLLDDASMAIEQKTVGPLEVQVLLRETIASAYYNLGVWGSSKPHNQWLVQYYQEKLGVGDPTTLSHMWGLGINQFLLDEWDEAITTFENTLHHAQQSLGDEHPITVHAMTWLGNMYTNKRDFFSARGPVLRAYDLAKQDSKHESWTLVSCIWHRAVFYHAIGKYRDAETDYLEAIALAERVRSKRHLWTLRMRNELVSVYRSEGDVARGSLAGKEVLELCRNSLGEQHPESIDALSNLAWALDAQGDVHGSESLYVDALTRSRGLANNHAFTRRQLLALGAFLEGQGRLRESQPLLFEALQISRETTGEQSEATLEVLARLASVACSQGDLNQGRHFKEQLVTSMRSRALARRADAGDLGKFALTLLTCAPVDPSHVVQALEAVQRANQLREGKDPNILDTLARAFKMNGQLEEAIEAATAAVANTPRFNPTVWHDVDSRLIQYLREKGDVTAVAQAQSDAERVYRDELQMRRSDQSARPLDIAHALFFLGMNHIDRKDFVAAEPILRECLEIRRNEGSDRFNIGNAAFLLGESLLDQQKYDEGEPHLLDAYNLKRNDCTPPLPVQDVVNNIATMYEAYGKSEKAAEWRARLDMLSARSAQGAEPVMP